MGNLYGVALGNSLFVGKANRPPIGDLNFHENVFSLSGPLSYQFPLKSNRLGEPEPMLESAPVVAVL